MKTNIDEVKELKALEMPGLVCAQEDDNYRCRTALAYYHDYSSRRQKESGASKIPQSDGGKQLTLRKR